MPRSFFTQQTNGEKIIRTHILETLAYLLRDLGLVYLSPKSMLNLLVDISKYSCKFPFSFDSYLLEKAQAQQCMFL